MSDKYECNCNGMKKRRECGCNCKGCRGRGRCDVTITSGIKCKDCK